MEPSTLQSALWGFLTSSTAISTFPSLKLPRTTPTSTRSLPSTTVPYSNLTLLVVRQVCFKLLDLNNEGELTRFPIYKILSSALATNSHDTNEMVDLIWSTVSPDDVEMKIPISQTQFTDALVNHRWLWRFFRHLLPLQAHKRDSRAYAVGRKKTRRILETLDDYSDEDEEDDEEEVELLDATGGVDDVLPEYVAPPAGTNIGAALGTMAGGGGAVGMLLRAQSSDNLAQAPNPPAPAPPSPGLAARGRSITVPAAKI